MLAAGLALLIAACTQRVVPASFDAHRQMTAEDRLTLFDAVWSHIDDRYYDANFKGTDWKQVRERYLPMVDTVRNDASMHRLISLMVGELHDAHSRYLPPSEAAAQRARITRTVGASVTEIDGIAVLESVTPGTPAARAGLEPGMRVVAVDGEPVEERFDRMMQAEPISSTLRATRAANWRRTLASADSIVAVEVEDDSSRRLVRLSRKAFTTTPSLSANMRADSVLVVRFDGFRSPIARELRDTLRAHPGAVGVVLDFRFNGGGDADETLEATGLFLERTHPAGTFFSRVPRVKWGLFRIRDKVVLSAGGAASPDRRPLVILTSVWSGSGAELMSAVLQEAGRATIVGDTTCGCLTAVTRKASMPGGGTLMISNRGYRSPNGTIVEGRGVSPDLVVRPTRDDLRNGHDPVLAAAVREVRALTVHANAW